MLDKLLLIDPKKQEKIFTVVAVWLMIFSQVIMLSASLLKVVLPGKLGTLCVYGVFTLLFALSIPQFIKAFTYKSLFTWVAFATGLLICCMLCGEETNLYFQRTIVILITCIPMYLAGRRITFHEEFLSKCLLWVPLFVNLSSAIAMVQGMSGEAYSQNLGYFPLPALSVSLASLCEYKLKKHPIYYGVNAILAVVIMLMSGARGPLASVLFIIAICMIRFVEKPGIIKNILIAGIIFLGVYIVSNLQRFALMLYPVFTKLGVSTRILWHIQNGAIMESTGRSRTFIVVWDRLLDNPIFGTGFFRDRIYLFQNCRVDAASDSLGYYPHNIFLEWMMQFGLIVGTAVIVVFFIKVFRTWRQLKSGTDVIVFFTLLTVGFSSLIVSGSYLEQATFYMLLGFMSIKGKKRRHCAKKTEELDQQQ